jgi:N-hydroxyarylamine O-acetyltransferase
VTATIDLDAYFQRIHWSGGRDPTLETLAGLIEAHTAHIPFENLDVLLGQTVRLDLDGLQDKIVGARRPVRRRARGARFQGRPSRRASCSVWALDRSEADPRVHDRGGRGRDLCCRSRLWSVRTPLSGAACGFVSGPDNYWMQRDGNFWVLHVTRGNGEPVAGWASTLEVENPLDFEVFNQISIRELDLSERGHSRGTRQVDLNVECIGRPTGVSLAVG